MGELVDFKQYMRQHGTQPQPQRSREPLCIAWQVEPGNPHRRHYRISGTTYAAVLEAIAVRNRIAERFNGFAKWEPVVEIANEFRTEGILVLPEETEKHDA